ncbi:MAG TPA: sigma-54-dependent Fis family transcriptional regulator [Spirochaetes bacterium]|nr:sigma-54-dependent Fis family transcriptional regulator [Spirochaetota bacterium]
MAKYKVLVVDDEHLIRWSMERNLTKAGYEVECVDCGEEAILAAESKIVDLVLLDIRLPDISGLDVLEKIKKFNRDISVIMITADDAVTTGIACMKAGAYDYVIKPVDFEELKIIVEKSLETASMKSEFMRMRHEQAAESQFENIVGKSKSMQDVFRIINRIAASDAATVLLQGESGTGKDLIARAIHYCSARRERSFTEINCAALPETLLESELMGYEKGAFTDAKTAKKGLFELADGGTLYLDEIGEMKISTQAKLLRIIENKRFKRVGGTSDIDIDVRIIAATNLDLAEAVREGRFRKDLYYRLKVIPVELPPLRERREDIPLLTDFFISKFNREFKRNIKGVTAKARDLLIDYPWPGNVRELKNIVERAIILESDEEILAEHLPHEIRNKQILIEKTPDIQIDFPDNGISLEGLEANLLKKALDMSKNNQTKAAKLLGLGRDALRYRMKKIGLLE